MNAFESGRRKAIPAVLVYVRCGADVLMVHRNLRPDDFHAGRWNGLGGKCEPDESPLDTARRELYEEGGLKLPSKRFRPLGVLQFPNFKAKRGEDWIVTVFTVDLPRRLWRAHFPCEEGTPHWIPARDVRALKLWPGDRKFLPLVLAGRPFLGSFWYRKGRLARHWLAPL